MINSEERTSSAALSLPHSTTNHTHLDQVAVVDFLALNRLVHTVLVQPKIALRNIYSFAHFDRTGETV